MRDTDSVKHKNKFYVIIKKGEAVLMKQASHNKVSTLFHVTSFTLVEKHVLLNP